MADPTPPPQPLTWRARIHARFVEIASAHATAPRLGVAVGVGVFVGSSPFYGFHALLGLALAKLLRLNIVAVVAGTNISLPFVAPFLVYGSVQAGHLVLHGEWLALDADQLSLEVAGRTLLAWCLGAGLVGGVLGFVGGGVTYLVVRALRSKL